MTIEAIEVQRPYTKETLSPSTALCSHGGCLTIPTHYVIVSSTFSRVTYSICENHGGSILNFLFHNNPAAVITIAEVNR